MKNPIKKGSKIYCNCYVGNRGDDKSFLCQGVVVESYDQRVMKVLITGVNTFCIGDPVSNRVLKALLGKTVPRNTTQINTSLSVIAEKLYSAGKWICWDEKKIQRILKQQKEKKKEEKRDGIDKRTPRPANNRHKNQRDRGKARKDGAKPTAKPLLLQTPVRSEQGPTQGNQVDSQAIRTGDGSNS